MSSHRSLLCLYSCTGKSQSFLDQVILREKGSAEEVSALNQMTSWKFSGGDVEAV